MRHGIAYLSEDRRRLGLSMPQSVASNITLPAIRSYPTPFGLLDRDAEKAAAGGFRDRLHIRTASLLTPVGNLSGGNQQKTMLAKWLNVAPRSSSSTNRPGGSTSVPRPTSTSSSTISLVTASP